MINAAGQHAQLEIRTTPAQANVIPVIASDWRRLGIDATEYVVPPQLGQDPEEKSKFPGLELRARGQGEGIFFSFDGRLAAYPHNRWQGANNSHYANPVLDRLIDRLYATLDPMERGPILKEMGELMANELPALPFYYTINFVQVRNSLRGPIDEDVPNTNESSGGAIARSAHLWARN